jgi:L-ascorbate metabolism protein UlaG (beta-lactamase superfamily)
MIFAALTSIVGIGAAPAAQPEAPATQPYGNVSASDVHYLERQAQNSLATVDEALSENPPTIDSTSITRKLALTLLDAILHEPNAPDHPAVAQFRLARTKRAIVEILTTKVTDDRVVFWEIYNMGFVVRTRSVTLGFDLVKLTHMPVFALDDATMKQVVDQCDVLFVSHVHLDHADHDVCQWALDAGKPVLAPPTMWTGEPIHDHLMHLPRDGSSAGHAVSIRHGAQTIHVTIYPGVQVVRGGPNVEDNVYIITTPEGFRIAHTGDNNIEAGLPAPDALPAPTDVLIMKLDPDHLTARQIVESFDPHLIVPAHFDEVGHVNLAGRQPFWGGIERLAKLDVPSVMMTWGEEFQYTRPTDPARPKGASAKVSPTASAAHQD